MLETLAVEIVAPTPTVMRRLTFKIYPSKAQEEALRWTLGMHQRLYNAALEERITAYKRCGKSLSWGSQSKELKVLRSEDPEYKALCSQAMNRTLKRLDDAYTAFFRRCKELKKKGGSLASSGFPKFKSYARYAGWGWGALQGWDLTLSRNATGKVTGGKLRLAKFGPAGTSTLLRLRGGMRAEIGTPKTCDICYENGTWYASVVVGCLPTRTLGKGIIALDWGLLIFATIVYEDNRVERIENPRFMRNSLLRLRKASRALARKKNFTSKRRAAAKRRVLRIYTRATNKRQEFLHQLTSWLVRCCDTIVTEALGVKGMTAEGGEYKKGLNREILSTAPAMFLSMLRYKLEEAGGTWVEVPTQKVKPSQTCSGCGRQEKKTLAERVHRCPACGLVLDRDENAARVMRNWALAQKSSSVLETGASKGLARRGAVDVLPCGDAESLQHTEEHCPVLA